MKLRTALMLVFLLMAVVPVSITMIYLNMRTADQYRERFRQQLQAISQIAEKRVMSVVDRVRDSTSLVASRTQMRILLADIHGDLSEERARRLQRILADAQMSMDNPDEISLYDNDGKLVMSTREQPAASSLVLAGTLESRIFLSNKRSMLILVSVRRLYLEGEAIGYLRISQDANFLLDLIGDRAGLGESGEWLVAIRDVNGDALFTVPLKYDSEAAFRRRVPAHRFDVPITQALLGNETFMQNAPDYRETPVMAYTRHIEGLGWGLVVKIDEVEIDALVAANQRLVNQFAVFAVALASLLGVGLALLLASPAETLRARVRDLRDGYLIERRGFGNWREAVDIHADLDALEKELPQQQTR